MTTDYKDDEIEPKITEEELLSFRDAGTEALVQAVKIWRHDCLHWRAEAQELRAENARLHLQIAANANNLDTALKQVEELKDRLYHMEDLSDDPPDSRSE